MKFKIKRLKLYTGWPYVAVMNELDAKLLGLHPMDRILIKSGTKSAYTILDVSQHGNTLKRGELGVFEELWDALQCSLANVEPISKPKSIEYIKKKMEGFTLNEKEIFEIIKDITLRRISDIEITYFVDSFYINGFTKQEVIWLTKAMVKTGEKLSFKGKVADKHCVGGVPGNRTTMIIVPIIAASGLKIPKTSSRSITSPAGTADTMEVLADVTKTSDEITKIVNRIGGCIVWGGYIQLAPADDQIIRIEHPLSIDAEGQLLASVIAKKISAGSKYLLIDIPFGIGSKCKTKYSAKRLGSAFLELASYFGLRTHVCFTYGSEPIGNGIGPALEAIDVMKVLENHKDAPLDLKVKALTLAGKLFELTGKSRKGKGYSFAKQILKSGKALKKMNEIIDAQGRKVKHWNKIKLGKYKRNIVAKRTGKLKGIDNQSVSKLARILGCPDDKYAGIFLYKHVGAKIKKGEKLFTLYAEVPHKLKEGLSFLRHNRVLSY